ncbi:PDZ domain-containing protein [Gemmata sp. JC673]|uniref:PDZ domain-containing protein n=1 Tax=Gemmata algarum TaxID=2975278 RepID=A0ABU5F6D8_9BACT|nr:PDZ domain-containing protein [Gemmata algarum]MDY3561868.1 PDZ domain-containing protein [Gemmata algarum]
MSFVRSAAAVAALCVTVLPAVGADAPALAIEVDARELPRRLVHTTLDIPCKPGPLRLVYPKWFPGSHGPHGRVEDVAGLRIETDNGTVVRWTRDEVDLYRFVVTVPDGTTKLRVKLDTVCESAGADRAGTHTVGTPDLGVINWNTCLIYPEGPAADDQPVNVRLQLPAGWKYATALKADGEKGKGDVVTFGTASLTTLVDCPLIAGRHLKTFKLDAGGGPPAFLHVTSESPEVLNLDPKIVDLYSRLVREAWALFGVAHYPEYHFLVVCSDTLGQFGLEHLSCSLNGVGERGLVDERLRKGWWLANLLPHEYAHSWCGKYRRPAAMVTPDFNTPQKTKLLWVYEGLTEYLGEVLSVRAGLLTPDEYRLTMTGKIRSLSRTAGRQWRPLEDTAVAAHLSRNPGNSWNQLRRLQDFYMEGMLLWYECDAIIREKTEGAKSLDDFCKRFFAAVPGKKTVAGYELADVVRDLKATAEYDWEPFLQRRVAAPQESLPLEVVDRLGYRLKYTDKAPGAGRPSAPPDNPAADSLGMSAPGGVIASVDPGLPADKAGLSPGMKVIGVNGKKFSANRLRDAIADSVARKKVELLVEDGEDFRAVVVPYADGLRYLDLERVPSHADVLGDILKPRAK